MSFHLDTLKLLGVAPAVSQSSAAELDDAERRIGRKLPASVREWYSLDGARSLLRQYSNDDRPVDVREFGLARNDTLGGGPHDLLARDLVVFRYENQAVCVWAFVLDGSVDPPVYVDFDTQFKTWKKCADSFSEHLYAWMWDYSLVLTREPIIQAQNKPLSEAALEFLKGNFDVGLETYGWPGHTQHRFSSQGQRILIWASEDQADWWLTADEEGSLKKLIATVRHCDQVGQSFWSNSELGESIL
ncbi:MAG: SMI1/KNR4 family protein, partial [Planctomycetota bacterium]